MGKEMNITMQLCLAHAIQLAVIDIFYKGNCEGSDKKSLDPKSLDEVLRLRVRLKVLTLKKNMTEDDDDNNFDNFTDDTVIDKGLEIAKDFLGLIKK